jgi:ATP-dependent DNA helicase RecG
MKRFSQGPAFDEKPMPHLSSEAIDFRAASESFSDIRKLKRSDLKTLRLMTEYQGTSVPTVGRVLLFGKERLLQFPDAWIIASDISNVANQARIN